jgi:hypothetical protein
MRRVINLGLAGPGAGDDEQRPAAMGHGTQLVRVESTEQGLEAWVFRNRRERRVHHRHEVAPGRELVERSRFAPWPGTQPGHGRRDRDCDGGHVGSIAGPRAT